MLAYCEGVMREGPTGLDHSGNLVSWAGDVLRGNLSVGLLGIRGDLLADLLTETLAISRKSSNLAGKKCRVPQSPRGEGGETERRCTYMLSDILIVASVCYVMLCLVVRSLEEIRCWRKMEERYEAYL